MFFASLSVPEEAAWKLNAVYSERIQAEADWKEGNDAFVDKREPRWTNALPT